MLVFGFRVYCLCSCPVRDCIKDGRENGIFKICGELRPTFRPITGVVHKLRRPLPVSLACVHASLTFHISYLVVLPCMQNCLINFWYLSIHATSALLLFWKYTILNFNPIVHAILFGNNIIALIFWSFAILSATECLDNGLLGLSID